MKKIQTKTAAVIMEYLALLLFIISAIYVFQFYIVRGVSGSWKKAGDVFSFGRQHDPRSYGTHGDGHGTLECFYSPDMGVWIATRCFEQREREEDVVCASPLINDDSEVTCRLLLRECSELQGAYADCANGS